MTQVHIMSIASI